ncbi:MAG: cytochrome c oxidase subunit II [Actinomycetota bacterium]
MQQAPDVRSPRKGRFTRPLLPLGLVLFLSACASDAPLDTLQPKGSEARTIDKLVDPVFAIAGVIFVLVLGAILLIVVKFRDSGDVDDEDLPEQTHGNLVLELGWTALPTLILAGVAVGTMVTLFELDDRPDDAIEISVTGQQWWWEFGYDVDGDGEDDFVTANEMVIPAGEPANVEITSTDVIHSFWIPPLNGKKDAVPGRTSPLTIEADEPGSYWGQCTEYCGLSHANMRMRVIALEPDEYDAWLENQTLAADGDSLTGEAAAGRDLFTSQCSTCHLIDGVNDEETVLAAAEARADETGEPVDEEALTFNDGTALTVSGTAPDLTHMMTRSTFAGSLFRMYDGADDDDIADRYLDLPADGDFNRQAMEAWLRDPTAVKPMAAPEAPTADTPEDDRPRGMPNYNLSEEQIDQLIAFLVTLD